jgi:hypothetical protein
VGPPPPSEPPTDGALSGIVTYRNWPPLDSLFDLRIVAFRDFPPGDILGAVLGGRAIVYPALGDTALVPFFVDSLAFRFSLPAGEYKYLAVVHQFGRNLFTDWRAVGQYDTDSDPLVPTPIVVPGGDTLRGVTIPVDFVNRPPPPFL